ADSADGHAIATPRTRAWLEQRIEAGRAAADQRRAEDESPRRRRGDSGDDESRRDREAIVATATAGWSVGADRAAPQLEQRGAEGREQHPVDRSSRFERRAHARAIAVAIAAATAGADDRRSTTTARAVAITDRRCTATARGVAVHRCP